MDRYQSVVASHMAPAKRDVKKVPFVELLGGRVQGVVSSGSDMKRVYVTFVEGGTGDFYCCTNNNRPCGGMYGSACKHLQLMMAEAVLQFGAGTVARYLDLGDADSHSSAGQILQDLKGTQKKESPGIVFSRFLQYLRFCELGSQPGMIHEMAWFVS